jgi:hypothetical protein
MYKCRRHHLRTQNCSPILTFLTPRCTCTTTAEAHVMIAAGWDRRREKQHSQGQVQVQSGARGGNRTVAQKQRKARRCRRSAKGSLRPVVDTCWLFAPVPEKHISTSHALLLLSYFRVANHSAKATPARPPGRLLYIAPRSVAIAVLNIVPIRFMIVLVSTFDPS